MAKKKLNIDPNYICAQQPFFSFYPKRIESTQRLNIKQKLGFFPFLYYSFHPKLLVIFSTFVYFKMLSSLKKSINKISILPLI